LWTYARLCQGDILKPLKNQGDGALACSDTEMINDTQISGASGVELSILMPCLNEAETIQKCINEARKFLAENNVNGEVVISDNGSTDGSQALAEEAGARVVLVAARGYGAALFEGTLNARGLYIIMGDADDSYDFTALGPFLKKLREGYDLVMGNRFLGGIRPGAMPWKNRYLGNPILSGIGRLFFSCPARDFHCGLRGYSSEAFRRLDLQTTGMEFASEMVIKANLLGMRIAEVPTTLDPDGRSRSPHLRPWRDGWRHLRFMLLYSPRWLFLIPGLLLMIVGCVGVVTLSAGNISVGSIHFGVHTMLYAAMTILVGYQAVVFSVFTKVYAISEGLLPEDPRLNKMFRFVKLESGLIVGAGVLLLSAIMTFYAFTYWRSRSYGPLDPDKMLRLVIPAVLFFVFGSQTVLSSFFLSVLGLRMRRRENS
jgi:glycosyltransferase involved in cell wall biosynthesis